MTPQDSKCSVQRGSTLLQHVEQFTKIPLNRLVGLSAEGGLHTGRGIFVVKQPQAPRGDTSLVDFRSGQPFAIVSKRLLKSVPYWRYRAVLTVPDKRFL